LSLGEPDPNLSSRVAAFVPPIPPDGDRTDAIILPGLPRKTPMVTSRMSSNADDPSEQWPAKWISQVLPRDFNPASDRGGEGGDGTAAARPRVPHTTHPVEQ